MKADYHPEHQWYGCSVTDRQHILWPILRRFGYAFSFAFSLLYIRHIRFILLLHVLQGCVPFHSFDSDSKPLLDFRLHIYDMTAPPSNTTPVRRQTERLSRRSASDEPTTLKVIKVIRGVSGGWTITDAHLSPDNERCLCVVCPVFPVVNTPPGSFTPLL